MTEIASNAADERKTKIIHKRQNKKQKGLRLRRGAADLNNKKRQKQKGFRLKSETLKTLQKQKGLPTLSVDLNNNKKQKRSTEGCSKFKSPKTRQVQEKLVSTLEHMQFPKAGQDQVSGGVSVLCWHIAPVAYVLWKPSLHN